VLLACTDLSYSHATATSVIHTLSLHDALPISFPDVNEYRGKLLEGIRDFSRRKENLEEKWLSFAPLISYHEMDLTDDESYRRMKEWILNKNKEWGEIPNIIFYLAVAPQMAPSIATRSEERRCRERVSDQVVGARQ